MEDTDGESSSATRYVRELCALYSRIKRPVVLVGPVGSGKTTFAAHLHVSSRRRGALVVVSAGELTDTLFSDVLFGHVAGAFTGASRARKGAYAQAAGGSLLLDDLALMSKAVQAAILRVLDTGSYRQLGAVEDDIADCRMLFASTVPPRDLSLSGHLLPDLASRLGEFIVPVPPLRARRSDIIPLAEHIARRFVVEHGYTGSVVLEDETGTLLLAYWWPTNVRELRGVIERAIAHAGISEEQIIVRPQHLPDRLRNFQGGDEVVSELTRAVVESAVTRAGGNKSEAARLLGIHRNTVARRLKPAG